MARCSKRTGYALRCQTAPRPFECAEPLTAMQEMRMATEGVVGRTFGNYRIVEQLGRGGMAEVYKAYQPGLDRYVAIKVMHAFLAEDKDFLARFQREAKLVASMRHSNIVQVHDFDVEGGHSYMVMEFIDGETLKNRLQKFEEKDQWISIEEGVRIVLAG